jgi:hypothetical protein
MPNTLRVTIGPHVLRATLELERAPKTCAAARQLWPLRAKLIQARWSGEAAWIPLGERRIGGMDWENNTSYPAAGELLLYPGGISEMEILVPYGACAFGSRMGMLAGNHFATLEADRATLREIGRLVVWEGAQDVTIEEQE